ncbi:EGF 2 domain containing protein, partial [Trichuris trichiura]
GGVCTRDLRPGSGKAIRCSCAKQYFGKYCQLSKSETTPACQNGGTCQGRGKNSKCICPEGYIGSFCEKGNSKQSDLSEPPLIVQ